jgi:hypothetical protein
VHHCHQIPVLQHHLANVALDVAIGWSVGGQKVTRPSVVTKGKECLSDNSTCLAANQNFCHFDLRAVVGFILRMLAAFERRGRQLTKVER